MKKISFIVATITFIVALSLNVISANTNLKISTIKGLVEINASEGGHLHWELGIDCGPTCCGDYDECSFYGTGNNCTNWGEQTCTCCMNCC